MMDRKVARRRSMRLARWADSERDVASRVLSVAGPRGTAGHQRALTMSEAIIDRAIRAQRLALRLCALSLDPLAQDTPGKLDGIDAAMDELARVS